VFSGGKRELGRSGCDKYVAMMKLYKYNMKGKREEGKKARFDEMNTNQTVDNKTQ
jgi:hypothetical protein